MPTRHARPRPWRALGLTGAALTLLAPALAACGDDEEPAATDPTPTASPTAGTPVAGAVADCVIGDWGSTEVTGDIGDDIAQVTLAGGADVGLSVADDGAADLDFADMAPVTVTGDLAGADLAGEITYSGTATGNIETTGTTSGDWQPADDVDWSDVRITLDLTEPFEGRPLDDVPLGEAVDQADEVTGDLIEIDPVLAEGSYECQDDTLVLSPRDDNGMTWTFTRA
ncbi:hypothetical protein JQS43_07015 [Natronosporangium hydrolyticum]|uniref:Uncharacterized protein n=1 Tax=Natronosporangium hydrolyticum TaxID=2811111 RepID=A0A895YL74_9ACTN|nr:hypothetical protein [Natronosporangium hydrolyticum]QSB16053.1 hypothetical protein JQS43_07015 [Natronosporangium hydrolyticum]